MRTARGTTITLAAGVLAALAIAVVPAGPGPRRPVDAEPATTSAVPSPLPSGSPAPAPTPSWDGKVKVLGDGSMADTGPQPNRPPVQKLAPGQQPPQFVVISWDGALENDDHLFSRFRELAEQNNAHMTFFLSGLYLVPKTKRALYHPPQHPVGTASIDFPTDAHIKATLDQLRQAWQDGDEIGTHFNGHFCGPKGAKGGGDWSGDEWRSEIDQAYSFVANWKTNTGFTDLPPLPFDYRKELVGGRAPCLEGQQNLLPVEHQLGWRYDASSPGELQSWPVQKNGVWNFPLQLIPYPDKPKQVLSMDYNFLDNQSGGSTTGDPKQYAKWEQETRDGYLNGFQRVYHGSRAPYFIGNHFETWNGGIYMEAVEDVVKTVCHQDGVRCVSFRELADWLDAQDPKVLQKLRQLDPGEAPDWSTFVKG